MTARGRMTMRAALSRDTQASPDSYNLTNPKDLTVLNAALPCFLYSKRTGRVVDGKKLVTIEDLRVQVPHGTDILGGDIITSVVDRLGASIHSTPLRIKGIQRRLGHIEAALLDTNQVNAG